MESPKLQSSDLSMEAILHSLMAIKDRGWEHSPVFRTIVMKVFVSFVAAAILLVQGAVAQTTIPEWHQCKCLPFLPLSVLNCVLVSQVEAKDIVEERFALNRPPVYMWTLVSNPRYKMSLNGFAHQFLSRLFMLYVAPNLMLSYVHWFISRLSAGYNCVIKPSIILESQCVFEISIPRTFLYCQSRKGLLERYLRILPYLNALARLVKFSEHISAHLAHSYDHNIGLAINPSPHWLCSMAVWPVCPCSGMKLENVCINLLS